MKDQYWVLNHPSYKSDYESIFINGCGEYPYSLPGITCSFCGDSWASLWTVPFEFPNDLRKDLNTFPRNISFERFEIFRRKLHVVLEREGRRLQLPAPGDNFLPLRVRFASRPRYDFLWPTLFFPVVSLRTKLLFEEHEIRSVSFHKIEIRKVGAMEPHEQYPMPDSGEPEDIVEIVPFDTSRDWNDLPLFLMFVQIRSGDLPGIRTLSKCSVCGHTNYDLSEIKKCITPRMLASVTENDLFFLGNTSYIVVRDRIKSLIESRNFTNVSFSAIPFVEEHQADAYPWE